MQILCTVNDSQFSLDTGILQDNPLILAIAPFVGPFSLRLKIHTSSEVKGICYIVNDPSLVYVSSYEEIPTGTYLAIFKEENSFVLFFCLSHLDLTTRFAKGPILHILSGKSREANKERAVLIALRGRSLHAVFDRLLSLTLEKTGSFGKLLKEKPHLPKCFNKLGWHSRLAFGEDITQDKILESIYSIRKEGFNLGFVIIEEGWQTLAKEPRSAPSLLDFGADTNRFPTGLKGLINELHGLGVEKVGVWHGMMGYKGGVHSRLAKHYDFPPDPFGRYFPGYDLGRTFQFFYDYYAYLKGQGVDFVKVGDQESTSHYCRKGMDVTKLYKNLQTAIQGASNLHFQSAQFNADCLRNENLIYWTNSQVASCGKPIALGKKATFAIRHHLCHTLWLQHLMQPDFDAWSTQGESSETLAIFHALSGTLNVISDPPGKHNLALLQKSVLPSGQLIKADFPLTLCEASVFYDPLEDQKIYKSFTMKGKNGIFALFHLSDAKKVLHGSFSPQEIPRLKGQLFAAFSFRHGFIGLIERSAMFSFKLKPGLSDVITLAPVQGGVALIGCHTIFLPPGPITNFNLQEESLHISTSFISPLLLYCEKQVLEIRRDGIAIPWALDQKRHLLSIDPKASIVEKSSFISVIFE